MPHIIMKEVSKIMNSFISWIGGKKLLRNIILENFPTEGTYNRYIEVFGGAGWVLFSKDRHAKFEVYNDINSNLVNLFKCVKYHHKALQEELEYVLMSREQFFDAKAQLDVKGFTDIQKAARFYILIKESFGSQLTSFGVKNRNLDNAKEYLKDVSTRLNNVVIENRDFEHLIDTYDKKDTLFYLDPPYIGTEKYYTEKFEDLDHKRLRDKLHDIEGKFLVSYNDHELVRELYSDFNIVEVDRANNLIKGENKPRYKELLIKNY